MRYIDPENIDDEFSRLMNEDGTPDDGSGRSRDWHLFVSGRISEDDLRETAKIIKGLLDNSSETVS